MLIAVPCPTCGVAAGRRYLLYSGGLRSEPHVNRKLAAAEAIEAKKHYTVVLPSKTGHLA